MPKIIAHALTGATIVAAVYPKAGSNKWIFLALGAIIAVSPDFDFALEWSLSSSSLHRGFTHSIIFSLIIGLIFWMSIAETRVVIAFSLAYLSHTLLDMATSTTGGVKLLYPFSDKFYHLGLTQIFELPIGSDSREILTWVLVETAVFLPIFIITLLIKNLLD